MQNVRHHFFVLCFLALAMPICVQAQTTNPLHFEVNQVYPFISISSTNLATAETLLDLNPRYKTDWVDTYESVEIFTVQDGRRWVATSKTDQLSEDQKKNLLAADPGTDIRVNVRYLPANNLRNNEMKELDFTFTLEPDHDAQYPGGQRELRQYLREAALDAIPTETFRGYDLAAVTFSINTAGEVVDAKVFESSKDAATDERLLAAICNMPYWQVATYADGTKAQQNFVLTVGNMENCMVYTLNIRRDF